MGSERRRATRHPVILDITMNLGGAAPPLYGRSVDVSRSGIFIMTEARIAEGRRVDLVIVGGESPLITSGTVVHAVNDLGIGIRFSNQTAMTRQRLEQLIEEFYLRKDANDDTAERTDPRYSFGLNHVGKSDLGSTRRR